MPRNKRTPYSQRPGNQGRPHRRNRLARRKTPFRADAAASSSFLESSLIAFLRQQTEAQSLYDMALGLDLDRRQRKNLKDVVINLCRRRLLRCTGKKLYKLSPGPDLVEGTISMHPRGFGFAILARPGGVGRGKNTAASRSDPFVSPANLGSAHHGDRVLFELLERVRGRQEARVVQVLERATTRLAGIFRAGRDTGEVVPEDERFAFTVIVHRENFCGARNGNAVLVEITDFPADLRNPAGRIIQVLGDPEDIAVQTRMVIAKFNLPYEFEAGTLAQADSLPATVEPDPARRDLRDILHVTIDGETARDFDDAVAITKTAKGFRLYVSIADVSHYVKLGSALDREAYRRGTSVYFPTMAVPMLPERLSNDLCSLIPDQDRPAFTAVLDFDESGKRIGKKFFKCLIRSRHRLTYTLVKQILTDNDLQLKKQYKTIVKPLGLMAELAAALEARRMARGSIGFTLPEAHLNIDDNGHILEITRTERYLSHKIIEEFMLAANEAVAETLAEHHQAALYRIHEQPNPMKVEEFTVFARSLGLTLPDEPGTPRWFGKILDLVASTPKEYIVNNLLLRTMQRARYSPDNVGHFGLAASHYTHFTSPIRRYPDLMVHRALAGLLDRPGEGRRHETGREPAVPAALTEAGDFLSEREKNATEAEWEMIDRLKVRFMADKVGEIYHGVIAGVTTFGLFVELLEWFVSGAVSMARLEDDHYSFDEKKHRLIGSYTGRILQMGDLVRVQVASVEVQQRRIDFILLDESRPASRKKQ